MRRDTSAASAISLAPGVVLPDLSSSAAAQPGWEDFPSSPMLYQVLTEVG